MDLLCLVHETGIFLGSISEVVKIIIILGLPPGITESHQLPSDFLIFLGSSEHKRDHTSELRIFLGRGVILYTGEKRLNF